MPLYDVFKEEWQGKSILEPCCGIGGISIPLIELGLEVKTNELGSYSAYTPDYPYDFLNLTDDQKDDLRSDWIVSNPPYKHGCEFVKVGFEVADQQLLLLRTAFLEGNKRYKELFQLGHLQNVYQFINRVSCTRGEQQEYTDNSVSYMWFHFNKNFVGNPTIHWVRGLTQGTEIH